MPLSEQTQAWLEAAGAALIVVGTANATAPSGIPEPAKTVISVFCWAAGTLGIALSQAAGIGKIPTPAKTT